mmetsp:Transcript_18062/g.30812  ORF Transcript_18062/g.30812 Transcript_18062/m.30812 type:complete len:90 (-) Transcript_18062:354-623(-)
MEHASQIYYDFYTNDLCLDVYSQIEDFTVQTQVTTAFIECYKVLVDCFNDFGQFYLGDTETTEKPFSPYAKIFDSCSLSNDATFDLRTF